jgi:hypothetical protein
MTLQVAEMLEAYPRDLGGVDQARLTSCIETCLRCAQTCTACADACLNEDMVADMTNCIRTDLDCADVCEATARVLSRHTGYDANITRSVLEACAQVCKACADECERHTKHNHCVICAQACRDCERACGELLAALG